MPNHQENYRQDNPISQPNTIRPENFSERLVWYSLIFTYVFYLLGVISNPAKQPQKL